MTVDGVDGDFARIRQPRLARGANTLEMASLEAAARPAGKAERDPKAWERVWVHRSFLSRAPRDPAAVVREALRAAPKDPEGALQLLDGAGQLAGTEVERAAMVRLAVERGYPAIAVKLAVQPPRGRAAWGSPVAGEVRFLLGCRGKRHVAALVDAGRLSIDDEGVHDLESVPEDACLEAFNPFPGCPPLEVDHPYSDYSLDPAQEDDGPAVDAEEIEGDEGGDGEGTSSEGGVTRAAAEEAYQLQLAAHQAEGERLTAELGRLTEAFPDGPWARITLRNTTDGYAPPIWSLRLVVTKREDCEDHRVLTEVAESAPLRIPALPPKATLDLWVQLAEYAGNELQLSLSPEQEDIFLGGASPSEPDCTVLCM